PGDAELADSRRVDLLQRAEALLVVGAPVGQPLAGLGLLDAGAVDTPLAGRQNQARGEQNAQPRKNSHRRLHPRAFSPVFQRNRLAASLGRRQSLLPVRKQSDANLRDYNSESETVSAPRAA